MVNIADWGKLATPYIEQAEAALKAGCTISINYGMPYIAIQLKKGGNVSEDREHYIQGEEADELLAEVPEWVHAEDYLLVQAHDWPK